jgi:hypothetical protein
LRNGHFPDCQWFSEFGDEGGFHGFGQAGSRPERPGLIGCSTDGFGVHFVFT